MATLIAEAGGMSRFFRTLSRHRFSPRICASARQITTNEVHHSDPRGSASNTSRPRAAGRSQRPRRPSSHINSQKQRKRLDELNDEQYLGRFKVVEERLLYSPWDRDPTPVPGHLLREMCPCSECKNPDTQQRNINVFKNPVMGEVEAVYENGPNFDVFFRDGHRSSIRRQTLGQMGSRKALKQRHGMTESKSPTKSKRAVELTKTRPILWDSEIGLSPPRVSYDPLKPDALMKAITGKIKDFGFVLVEDMPVTPEATQALLESIGPIRNTHYGGFYDFTADLASKDTAYTSEALEPHTDNTYFTEPAGLQALHMLSHREGHGGESILVDGFKVAQEIRMNHPHEYDVLSTTAVWAHASGNEGISIQPAAAAPVLQHDVRPSTLQQVRWNNADRAILNCGWDRYQAWYDAARLFDKGISKPENQYQLQLKPGTTLIFDNWRILHGRTEFSGIRRMCGGYINRDDWISRWKMHHLSKEELQYSTI